MITSLTIDGPATFKNAPAVLTDLKTVNYFYGSNGSGKTTISRVIDNPQADYPDCSIGWTNNSPLPTLVYNRDFVDQNFARDTDLKGVFTVGEDNMELQKQIKDKQQQIETLTDDRNKLDDKLNNDANGAIKLSTNRHSMFVDTCWSQKTKHADVLEDAFRGDMGAKRSFCTKLLEEAAKNHAEPCDYDDLVKRAETVFGEAPEKLGSLTKIETADLEAFERDDILTKPIVGSEDVDLSALIEEVGSADWVKQGTGHLAVCKPKCPFCQQEIPHDLEDKLAAYFDSSYQADCETIKKRGESYAVEAESIQTKIGELLENPDDKFDTEALRLNKQTLDALIDANKRQWLAKLDAPATAITLDSTSDTLAKINELIEQYNTQAKDHNKTVDNLATEKAKLIAQVWRYLLDVELKDALVSYTEDMDKLNKLISGLKIGIAKKNKTISEVNAELEDLETKTTSVKPTRDAINKLLTSFGFTTFSLVEAPEKPGSYRLMRGNGEPASHTLSDGERTFLTFLYFYHLVQGSHDATGTSTKRVVVVDDPVSSIDSDTLFVVSNLLKNIFREARDDAGSVAQVFVLTHNIYFHKEMTFDTKRNSGDRLKDETFWVVRRHGEKSSVEYFNKNPIQSSYDLLWAEVRKENPSPLTICNNLRRILEHYFKLLGGVDQHQLHEGFEGEEKVICRSLVSWINDGSHFAMEDLHLSQGPEVIDKYRVVFTKIFETQGHLAHHDMMMAKE